MSKAAGVACSIELGKGYLIIPRAWYQNLVNQNGRSDWLAISILGEMGLYGELYFTSFENIVQYFCELYGVSKVCTRRALKRLEKKELISIADWGNNYRWEVPDGMTEPNSWSVHITSKVHIEIDEVDNEIYL